MDNLPGGCKSREELSAYVRFSSTLRIKRKSQETFFTSLSLFQIHRRIEECMKQDKNKEETMKHLMDHYQITPDMTSIVWDILEATYPEEFRAHYESCEAYRRIREASVIHSYQLIPRWFRDKREIQYQQRRCSIKRYNDDAVTSQEPQESALLPRDFKSVEEFSYYVHGKIMECMRNYKSKEETVKHLLDRYQITPESTNEVWDRLEQRYQRNFKSYYEACEKKRKLREQEAPKVTATAQTTAETRSCSTSLASKTRTLKSLKDIKVMIKLEKQLTCPPVVETGQSSQVPRLGPDAQANGPKDMNLEQLLLLLNLSKGGA
ncbi:unnamed protein product [Eruca vesicaria subsp. sativa]|uniref:Uncharacterized protein n=1 Tax=Eruca vesicaria subsp. sativa TaxID=29727 RepID=A0ABC8L1R5_ERUVS|nr:unnamed protein product [Eruca vesicaria subsp. sativa]